MLKFFYIGIGGAAGSLLRYGISGWTQRFLGGTFPWGTLSVNLIGSLVIGVLWGIFESTTVSENTRLLVIVGVLGGFTTFSAFSLESFELIRQGEYTLFAANAAASVFLGITLVFAGHFVGRALLGIIR